MAVPGFINESDPIKAISWWGKRFVTLQTDTLVRFDSQGGVQPWLAKRWSLSLDRKTLYIELRDGVFFSNGDALTVADTVNSLKRWKDNLESIDHGRLDLIKDIQITSKHSFQIILKKPFYPLISYLATPRSGIVKLSNKNIIGSGPWLYKQGNVDSIVFTANKKYFQSSPKCQELKLIKVDTKNSLAEIKNANVDLVEYFSFGSGVSLDEMKAKLSQSAQIYEFPTYDITMLFFTNEKKKSIPIAQRKWLFNHIFQSKVLLYNNFTHLSCTMLPRGLSFVSSDLCIQKVTSNLQEVKPVGTIEIFGPEDERIELINKIAETLRTEGVSVIVRPVDLKTLYSKHGAGEVVFHLETFTMQVPDPYGVLSMYLSNTKENFSKYSNPKFDMLLTQAISSSNQDSREQLNAKAMMTLASDFMLVPLINESRFLILRKEVSGFVSQSIGPFYANYNQISKSEGDANGK